MYKNLFEISNFIADILVKQRIVCNQQVLNFHIFDIFNSLFCSLLLKVI